MKDLRYAMLKQRTQVAKDKFRLKHADAFKLAMEVDKLKNDITHLESTLIETTENYERMMDAHENQR